MDRAADLFSDDCEYEDTQYSSPFTGKPSLRSHLLRVASSLPPTFTFVVDATSSSSSSPSSSTFNVGVQWHVENDGKPLPFTRGCSMYTVENDLITKGFDVPEPAPIKQGDIGLSILGTVSKVIKEPVRALPLLLTAVYGYMVFFSNGIIPGADATQLEQRTWEEVIGLSLNFFLVAPLFHLSFSPSIHPSLEGIFNLLLSWAAMFSGFLATEKGRDEQGGLTNYGKTLIGMQFLTSAFYLPYLGLRSSDVEVVEAKGGWGERIGESKLLALLLSFVGVGSVAWGIGGRIGEGYGDSIAERVDTLGQLLSIDRVGCSFLVDLCVFAAFQGWMVEDDMKRRGVGGEGGREPKEGEILAMMAGKYVPFLGLSAYLLLRPGLAEAEEVQ